MTLPDFGQPITDIDPGGSGPITPGVDGWELLEDITVAADATQVDITGLDGDTDELYLLIVSLINLQAGVDADLTMRFNADGGANYLTQMGEWDGAAATAARTTALTACDLEWIVNRLTEGLLVAWINAQSGFTRDVVTQAQQQAANIFGSATSSAWLNSVANMTQISLISAGVGSIGAGSRLWLFRPAQ